MGAAQQQRSAIAVKLWLQFRAPAYHPYTEKNPWRGVQRPKTKERNLYTLLLRAADNAAAEHQIVTNEQAETQEEGAGR